MLVLDHVSITVKNLDQARPFYDAIMSALNVEKVYDYSDALGYSVRCDSKEDFHTYLAVYESPESNTNTRRHWCFKASTRTQVKKFHEMGLANGGLNDGVPGLRPHYHKHYFGAFLIDTDGNRVEAVCHRAE